MIKPILDKSEAVFFRNELIFAVDAKVISLDNVLVNLFMLMRNNGSRIGLKLRKNSFHTIDTLKDYFGFLEDRGEIDGARENPAAIESWLRSSLINLVFRGKADKESVASLRPLHLESYRLRNQKHTRDYNSADQLFIMLNKHPEVMTALKEYLSIGWDNASKKVASSNLMDVDTAGVLQLLSLIEIDPKVSTNSLIGIRPLLDEQADLFCDDVKRLLFYQYAIPRSVFIEYLRILCGFHLSLYLQKLIRLLPRMIDAGTSRVEDDWSIVVDITDSLDGKVANIACADMASQLNGLMEYIICTLRINAAHKYLKEPNDIDAVLSFLKNPSPEFEMYYRIKVDTIRDRYDQIDDAEEREAAKKEFDEYLQYESSYFEKYVQCLAKVRAAYQYKYYPQYFDSASMKNKESAFLMDGRSRKYPRRAVIGSKLLEVLVQLVVLNPKDGLYEMQSLSINELIQKLRHRYGLVIDGTSELRFKDADITTHLAFKENVEALKNKLRQIGFYTDLSDASIMQKIRPRYNVNE